MKEFNITHTGVKIDVAAIEWPANATALVYKYKEGEWGKTGGKKGGGKMGGGKNLIKKARGGKGGTGWGGKRVKGVSSKEFHSSSSSSSSSSALKDALVCRTTDPDESKEGAETSEIRITCERDQVIGTSSACVGGGMI
jgi:hypothetical protein